MESATASERSKTATGRLTAGGLARPLGLHAVMLLAYLGVATLIVELTARSFSIDSTAFGAAIWLAGWVLFAMVPAWVVLAVAICIWWRQERRGLVRVTLAWDALLWLGVFRMLLLLRTGVRRKLVPPRAEA